MANNKLYYNYKKKLFSLAHETFEINNCVCSNTKKKTDINLRQKVIQGR